MSLSGLILGLINIGIVILIFVLAGAIALWIMTALKWPPPEIVQHLYLGVVALIALYLLVALLFGITPIRIIGEGGKLWSLPRYGSQTDAPSLGACRLSAMKLTSHG